MLSAVEEESGIMRFTRGTRVEVLDWKEVSLGSWRCGEIIADNRHSCTVRYYGQNRKNTLGKVSCSVLRPFPPHLAFPKKWAPADVLEVFNDFSWKMGRVMKSLGGVSYVVRVLGTSEELMVDVSSTRVRQSWHNGKWTIIGQVSGFSNEWKKDCHVEVETKTRRSSHLYEEAGPVKKRRICRKERICCSEVIANQTKSPELTDMSLRIQESAAGSSCSISHAESDDASSTGSCSITDGKCCKLYPRFSAPAEDVSGNMSDSESCSNVLYEEHKNYIRSKSGQRLKAEVHRLELLAYRRTMEALHASGALSWEQQSLMSNLRVSLNITSEEYLTELRGLLSANNGTPFR